MAGGIERTRSVGAMMDAIEEFEHRGLTVKIFPDIDSPESPLEWENLATVFVLNPSDRYSFKDTVSSREHEESYRERYGDYPGSVADWELYAREVLGATVVLPLYMYVHSGVTVSIGDPINPFGCDLDSRLYALVFDTAESRERCGTPLERVEECLRAEMDTFDQWLRGDVYGYVVEDAVGEHLDSCYGFYGLEGFIEQAKGGGRLGGRCDCRARTSIRCHDLAPLKGLEMNALTGAPTLFDIYSDQLGRRDSRKLERNTYLERGEGFVAIRLHATHIVRFFPDGSFELRTGGWRTKTTIDRIRDYAPVNTEGYDVWHLHGGPRVRLVEGQRFIPDGANYLYGETIVRPWTDEEAWDIVMGRTMSMKCVEPGIYAMGRYAAHKVDSGWELVVWSDGAAERYPGARTLREARRWAARLAMWHNASNGAVTKLWPWRNE